MSFKNMANTPEMGIDRIFNQAVRDLEFQRWLIKAGLLKQDPPEVIENFERVIPRLRLTPKQLQIVEAHKPYGFLTTYSQIATKVYDFADSSEKRICAVYFSLALMKYKKYNPSESDPAVTVHAKAGKSQRGIGCQTFLTDYELALAYVIPGRAQPYQPVSYSDLVSTLFPELDQESEKDLLHATGNVATILCRLDGKLPDAFRLQRQYRSNRALFSWPVIEI